MSERYDELERLQRLRQSGALSDAEFEIEKRRLLGHGSGEVQPPPPGDVAEAREEMHSRLPLYLVIAAGTLIVAVVAGLLLGRLVSGPAGDSRNLAEIPQENAAADVNLVQAPPPPDIRTLAPAEQLARAFEAAFGARGAATLKVDVGEPAQTDGFAESVRYTPGKLFWTSFGPILVSEGSVTEASHASTGKIAVHYLKPAGDRFEVVRSWPTAVVTGSLGRVARWSVSTRFSDLPVIVSEGGGTWQGYTCSWAKLTELRPAGPAELATVALTYDDGGAVGEEAARAISGRIINVVRNVSFDVVYTGARSFSEHWARGAGGGYAVAGGGSQMKTC
jgi:hypothetical protein